MGLCELDQLKEITVQYNPLITPPAFVCTKVHICIRYTCLVLYSRRITKGVDDIKKWLAYINQVVNEAPQRNKINFTRNMSFTTSDDSFGILRKDGVHVSTRVRLDQHLVASCPLTPPRTLGSWRRSRTSSSSWTRPRRRRRGGATTWRIGTRAPS